MHRKALNTVGTAVLRAGNALGELEARSRIRRLGEIPAGLLGGRRAGAGSVVATKEKIGANEGIQIAIDNFIHIAALKFCAVVLDELVRLHGVGANLAAEADFGLRGVKFMEGFAALFQFELVKLRAEDFHSPFAVLVLAALVLALNDDAGWKMRDADGGFDFVDVLPAVAAGAECVDAKIVGLDHDVDFVVDLRDDEHGGEGRVAAGGLIERRDAYEAMHAAFTREHAVSIFSRDLDGSGLDSRFFTGS